MLYSAELSLWQLSNLSAWQLHFTFIQLLRFKLHVKLAGSPFSASWKLVKSCLEKRRNETQEVWSSSLSSSSPPPCCSQCSCLSLWRSGVFPRADAGVRDDGARWLIIGSSWSYVMEWSDLSSCVLPPHTCVYAADVCVCALVCACVCLPETGEEKAQSACT